MIVDSHCHLHDAAFADTRETVAARCASDVWGVVAVGCDPGYQRATSAAADGRPQVGVAAPGLPSGLGGSSPTTDLERVEAQVAEHHRAHRRGVGEIGLPWYSLEHAADAADADDAGPRAPRAAARAGRALRPAGGAARAARRRRRRAATRSSARRHRARGVPLAQGAADVTRAIVDAGYFVSVSPEVVYRERDRELVAAVPLESLLVESDGPWPYRGRVRESRLRALARGARGRGGGQDQAPARRRRDARADVERLPRSSISPGPDAER